MKQRYFRVVDEVSITDALRHYWRMFEYVIENMRRGCRFHLFRLRNYLWPYTLEELNAEIEHMERQYEEDMQRLNQMKSAQAIYETQKRWKETRKQ